MVELIHSGSWNGNFPSRSSWRTIEQPKLFISAARDAFKKALPSLDVFCDKSGAFDLFIVHPTPRLLTVLEVREAFKRLDGTKTGADADSRRLFAIQYSRNFLGSFWQIKIAQN